MPGTRFPYDLPCYRNEADIGDRAADTGAEVACRVGGVFSSARKRMVNCAEVVSWLPIPRTYLRVSVSFVGGGPQLPLHVRDTLEDCEIGYVAAG